MTTNVGTADRLLRFALGIVLIALPFLTAGFAPLWTAVSVIVGLVMLATSAMKFCPLYSLFGIRTCKLS